MGFISNGGGGGGSGAMLQKAETVLSASAATITLSSLGGSSHLLLLLSLRSDTASASDDCHLTFNADSGANYTWQGVDVTPGGAYATTNTTGATSATVVTAVGGTGSVANAFGVATLWVPDYGNTTTLKSGVCHGGGIGATGTIRIKVQEIQWNSTSAITSITLTPSSGGNWVAHSRATAYGIT